MPTHPLSNWWGVSSIGESYRASLVSLELVAAEERFQLAKWVLLGTALLFVLGSSSYLLSKEAGVAIFETCKTVLPPLATLVIGYYFSERAHSGSV